jgi:hypothetical protein
MEASQPSNRNPEGPSITDLSLHDQLLHGIGRVAQAHVVLEVTLRGLFVGLAAPPSPAGYLAAQRNSVGQLTDDCRLMLANSELPEKAKLDGDEALKAGIEADKLRQRVVHDWWVQRLDATGAISFDRYRIVRRTLGFTVEPSDLGFIDDAEARLQSAQARISALSSLVVSAVPGAEAAYDVLLSEIRGEITPPGRE